MSTQIPLIHLVLEKRGGEDSYYVKVEGDTGVLGLQPTLQVLLNLNVLFDRIGNGFTPFTAASVFIALHEAEARRVTGVTPLIRTLSFGLSENRIFKNDFLFVVNRMIDVLGRLTNLLEHYKFEQYKTIHVIRQPYLDKLLSDENNRFVYLIELSRKVE